MNWLLALLILAGIALFVWWLIRKPIMTHGLWTHGPFSRGSYIGGHSVWCFEGGIWRLLEDHSAPGYVPGPPPSEPGKFDGDCVKVPSVRGPGAR